MSSPKLIAGISDRFLYKIYDDYTVVLGQSRNGKLLPGYSSHTYGPKFMSYLKRLEPGKRYNFYGWGDDRPFEKCSECLPKLRRVAT